MRKLLQLSIFLLAVLSANAQITFSKKIASSTDDAEENQTGTYTTTTSSDLELVYDSWGPNTTHGAQGLQTIGLRFTDITIPKGSVISKAYIKFTADGNTSGNVELNIKGELSVNAQTFSHGAGVRNAISGRTKTTNSVTWKDIPNWVSGQSGTAQTTPDLSAIVTEIINQENWQRGNSIAFIINGNGENGRLRRAFSFNGNSGNAAELFIEYSANPEMVDLAVSRIINPKGTKIYQNKEFVPEVEISNLGGKTVERFQVHFYKDGERLLTETVTRSLPSAGKYIVKFSETADFTSLGNSEMKYVVETDDDDNAENNSIATQIEIIEQYSDLFFGYQSPWSYYSGENAPAENWLLANYDDADWGIGDRYFGFGISTSATYTVMEKGTTAYFRKKIKVQNLENLQNIYLNIIHDDAAVIYINGKEILRSELMPNGTVGHLTTPWGTIGSSIQYDYFTYKLDKSHFVEGENIIAISVHTRDSDLAFSAYVTKEFSYSQDGPYVFYKTDGTVNVAEVTPNGLVENNYSSRADLPTLTSHIPQMGKSFSFNLKEKLEDEPDTYPETPEKFLVISDFDNLVEAFSMVLKGEGIIDDNFNWIYGNGHLIITGDLFDRGVNVSENLWLIYKLEQEAEAAGGKIHLIIGNHEMMNLIGDWRYIETKYFNNAMLMKKRMMNLYYTDTEIGKWLRTKNIMKKIGPYIFMHGGISPQVTDLGIDISKINEYGKMRMNFQRCDSQDATCQNQYNVVNSGTTGVYWYRGLVRQEVTEQEVDRMLNHFEADRIIVGHTKDNEIRSLYNGKVLAIDIYHQTNFKNGFMQALQFQAGCFRVFETTGNKDNSTYTQLGECDEYLVAGENILPTVRVYPNPTSSLVYVDLPKEMSRNNTYFIYDMSGKLLKTGKISSDKNAIDISNFSVGKYILTINGESLSIKGHFILKN
ncbi:MAG: metallophosphoesterase [Cruoricaptor ignavus]|nr:metallophosphoesterase [Cruoricaptor ignavus]